MLVKERNIYILCRVKQRHFRGDGDWKHIDIQMGVFSFIDENVVVMNGFSNLSNKIVDKY